MMPPVEPPQHMRHWISDTSIYHTKVLVCVQSSRAEESRLALKRAGQTPQDFSHRKLVYGVTVSHSQSLTPPVLTNVTIPAKP